MLLNDKRNVWMRKIMLSFLLKQVQKKDFSVLPKLYEMSKLDNKKLQNKAHEIRNIFENPSDTVYTDMAYLIYDESERDGTILDHFYDIAKKLFPNKFEQYERFLEYRKSGNEKQQNSYLKNTYHQNKDEWQTHLCLYILLYFDEKDIVSGMEYEYEQKIREIDYVFLQTDQNLTDEAYVFNSGEKIFETIQFERYIKKRKIQLAEYLSELYGKNITEETLMHFIHSTLKSRATATHAIPSNSIDSVPTGVTGNIIVEQNGGMSWYNDVTNDGKTGRQKVLKYRPDIERLIYLYFKEYIKMSYREYLEKNNEGFSKKYMADKCVPQSSEVYLSLMYMYNIDVICKMFNNVKDDYYLNFSWEKITHQTMQERYNKIISDKDEHIQLLKDKLEAEVQRQAVLKEQLMGTVSKDKVVQFEQTIGKLGKTVDEKNEEIVAMKRQLESKEEYIQLLISQDDEEAVQEINLDLLRQKRYLFVGRVAEVLPELKKNFSNSVFMESENMSIKNLQVDAVVMLIKYMSHSMYYKINATGDLEKVPYVYCNTKNINTVYGKMMDALTVD